MSATHHYHAIRHHYHVPGYDGVTTAPVPDDDGTSVYLYGAHIGTMTRPEMCQVRATPSDTTRDAIRYGTERDAIAYLVNVALSQ